jgi:hypothetical protein
MLIDRINAWLISRLPSRRSRSAIAVTDAGLRVTTDGRDELVGWSRIQRVVAARAAQTVGDTLLLVVGLDDGRALTVPADSPAWAPLTAALPTYLSGARPYEEWALELAGAAPDAELTVFSR